MSGLARVSFPSKQSKDYCPGPGPGSLSEGVAILAHPSASVLHGASLADPVCEEERPRKRALVGFLVGRVEGVYLPWCLPCLLVYFPNRHFLHHVRSLLLRSLCLLGS
jgi:hypothetical protein